jgi:HD-GYP domain-containing protein (c-di-GMP phosphodiesterase class II)
MTSPRSWRPALPHEQAIHELLDGAGTQFDPEVIEVLVSHLNGMRQAAAYLEQS